MAPCIPDLSARPSFKTTVKGHTFFSVGAGGVGFVMLNPIMSGSDAYSIKYTNDNYASSNIQITGTGVLETNLSRTPWTTASASSSRLQLRLVGCGIRVTYTGKLIDRNGVILTTSLDQGVSPVGLTYSSLNGFGRTTLDSVDGKARQAVYMHTQASGYWTPDSTFDGPTSQTQVVFVSGEPGTRFSAEFIVHYEAHSTQFQNTATDSDPVGMGAIYNSLPNANPSEGGVGYAQLMNRVAEYLSATTNAVTQAAPYIGLASRYYRGSSSGMGRIEL